MHGFYPELFSFNLNDYPVMDLKICPLNVRDLGERLKRRETFNWLREKKFSIYLLQETHCSENTTTTWSSEWELMGL